MTHLIAWCGFIGAWLLFAGPIYQATIELADEDLERDELEARIATVEPPPGVSAWWLLLPPVAYALRRRRRRLQRRAYMDVLTPEQLEGLMHYSETATAWMFVASGAFLIATKETWDLHEEYDWPVAVFWALLVLIVVASAWNTAVRVRRRHAILDRARGA